MESTPELAYDLIRLILLKLSVKLLIRFRSVSKLWKEIISNNTFIYEQHYNNLLALSEGEDDGTQSFLAVHWYVTPVVDKYFSRLSIFQIDGSLNCRIEEVFRLPYISCGVNMSNDCPLIYPAGFGIYCLFEFITGKTALWNPATKELKALPLSPIKTEDGDWPYPYGFAQVFFKDDIFSYTVGKMTTRWDEGNKVFWLTIELYSSIEDSWKVLKNCRRLEVEGTTGTFHNWIFSGANLNDMFHCLNWQSREDPHIITFDTSNEEFGRFEVPGFLKQDSRYNICFSLLTKFDEKFLCLLLYWNNNNEEEIYIDVWVMLKYGVAASWTKKSTTGPIINIDAIEVLGISKRAGVLFLDMEKGLSFCRLGSQKLWHQNSLKFEQVVEIRESLVFFNGTSDNRRKL